MNKTEIFEQLKAMSAAHAAEQPLPSIWTHEIGKPLIGQIKGFSNFQHSRYGLQDTVIVELESGELVSAILTDYLVEGMQRQNAKINDFVLIELLGKDLSRSGNAFNKFSLQVVKI